MQKIAEHVCKLEAWLPKGVGSSDISSLGISNARNVYRCVGSLTAKPVCQHGGFIESLFEFYSSMSHACISGA